jgi:hypothetical protein
VPELWAAEVLRNLHKTFVYASLCNTNYEGDVKNFGDTVRINSIGALSVSAYTKNTDMVSPPALTDAQTVLSINKAQYLNFQIDDVDAAQARPSVMAEAMYESGIALADDLDQFIAALNTDAANTIGTSAAEKTDLATAGQPYVYLTQLKQKLDESNVPSVDRWVVVPPWFEAFLLQDQRFVQYGTPAQIEILRSGVLGPSSTMAGNQLQLVGRIAGFDVYRSNNVPNTAGDKYKIIAGHPMAITYASQLTKVEAYTPPLRFADAVKMLHIYGAKVVKPAALAVLTARST